MRVMIEEAGVRLEALIDRACLGEEVVIVRGDAPIAQLVAVDPPGRRKFGRMRGEIVVDDAFFEPLSDEELAAWDQ